MVFQNCGLFKSETQKSKMSPGGEEEEIEAFLGLPCYAEGKNWITHALDYASLVEAEEAVFKRSSFNESHATCLDGFTHTIIIFLYLTKRISLS